MKRFALTLLLAAVALPVSAQQVVLLRHAEKVVDGSPDPPLTAYGTARAEALIGVLMPSGLTAAVSSGLKRAVDTVRPAAEYFGAREIFVGVSQGLAMHVQATADTVRALGPDAVVVVSGHSNTIPRIVHALGGPDLPDLNDAEYDLLYFMDLNGPEPVTRKIYWRPVE